jgi:hypothetical protein
MSYNYKNSILGDYITPSGNNLIIETPIIINSGSIDNTKIGDQIPSTGKFTSLQVNDTNINKPSGESRTGAIAVTNSTELLIETKNATTSNLWTFGIDGSTILPENTLKGYCFTSTNTVTNYIPQAASFLYADNPILRLILSIGGSWYIKGPGLVGWKQITAAQDNGGVSLILRIGSGSTPLPDGSEFPSGGGNVYTISQYVEFDLKVADKTWKFKEDGNLTLPASGDILASNGTSILNSKAPLDSPTFTGTVGGITKSMVGLDNVDNTSDANKPVSTAQQSALDGKAASSHTHTSSNITDFNSSVSGLLPSVSGSGYATTSFANNAYTVSVTGLQPSGNYSTVGHTHTSSNITDFNSSVSGLLPSVSGSTYITSSLSNNIYTISTTGLQPSGNYSLTGHTHTVSNITDFNSSVSGLLPTISNSGDNRILTSTGTSTGINAESNITFDGSGLNMVSPSGFILSSLGTPPPNYSVPDDPSGNPATRITLVQENYSSGPHVELRYAGPASDATSGGSGAPRLILAKSKGSYISPQQLDGNEAIGVIRIEASPALVESSPGVRRRTSSRIIVMADGAMGGSNVYQPSKLALEVSSGSDVIDKNLTISSNGAITTNCSLSVDNGVSSPVPIYTLGTVSGNTAISFGIDRQIQKLTLNGTSVNFTEGTGWDITNRSVDVVLEITVSSTTTVAFDSNFITDWYGDLPTFTTGKYLILLRSMGTGVVQGHYIGIKN